MTKNIRPIDCPSCGAVQHVVEENGEPESATFMPCGKCSANLCNECSKQCEDCNLAFCPDCLIAPLPVCDECAGKRDVHDWYFDVQYYCEKSDRSEDPANRKFFNAVANAALSKVNEMLSADPSKIGGEAK